jgi:hypothetical protein
MSSDDLIHQVRLDVEGAEYAMLEALTRRPELLCFVSFVFVEFHHSATPEQRARLTRYRLDEQVCVPRMTSLIASLIASDCLPNCLDEQACVPRMTSDDH